MKYYHNFLSYLYYRMYKGYLNKNDDPLLRTFMYLTYVQFIFVVIVLIYLRKLLVYFNLLSEVEIAVVSGSYFFWGGIVFFIFIFTYYFFTKVPYTYFEEKFNGYEKLNSSIKSWMLVVFPFAAFILSINILILLFGGWIFGRPIEGFLKLLV